MNTVMSLQVEELESLDAASENDAFWEGVAVGIVVGGVVLIAIT